MSATLISCSLCGYRYDPETQPACGACPLHKGCHLVCCPACGYSEVDPTRSTLARLVALFRGEKKNEQRPQQPTNPL